MLVCQLLLFTLLLFQLAPSVLFQDPGFLVTFCYHGDIFSTVAAPYRYIIVYCRRVRDIISVPRSLLHIIIYIFPLGSYFFTLLYSKATV